MGIKVTFDGMDLTTLLEVIEGFTPFDGADFSPVITDRASATGGIYISTKIESKQLPMPFIIKKDVRGKYDKLMKILNVKEPKILTFSNLPNREFYAIPTGSLGFTEEFMQGKGTINWTIPDGVGHSPVRTRVPFVKTAEGTLEATLINNGTDYATVDYTINMKHENGYVGIISEYGAIQLGNPNEVDMVPAEKSIRFTANGSGDFKNWVDGTTFYENPSKTASTTLTSDKTYGGRLGLVNRNFTNKSNTQFYGGIKEVIFNDTAANWYIWAKARFETGLMGQTGSMCLSIVDSDNRVIAAMLIEKSDGTGNRAYVRFMAGDGKGGKKQLKHIDFTPSYWVKDNPYGGQSLAQNRMMFDIRKEGKRVTFYWYGKYFPYDIPEIENSKASRVQLFCGQFRGRNSNDRTVTQMYINDFSFDSNKVPYMKDVPNKYPSGSTIYIDGENKKPYFNNMLRLSDEVLGSTYFKIPPGETVVKIAYSDFADPAPEAYAVVNEVFI